MDGQQPNQSAQDIQIPEDIRSFLNTLLDDAGMTIPEVSLREEMIRELFTRLDQFILSRIIDNLSEEDFETFVQMNEQKKSREEIEKFFTEHMSNAQEVMRNAFAEFRQIYLGNLVAEQNDKALAEANGSEEK